MDTEISKAEAKEVARNVFDQIRSVLDEGLQNGALQAFLYSGGSFEGWLVHQTYARVFSRWESVFTIAQGKGWKVRMEEPVLKVGRATQRVDLYVGPKVGGMISKSAPIFEFKILREDNWIKTAETLARKDLGKLRSAGIMNGYLVNLYLAQNNKGLDWCVADARERFGELHTDPEMRWGPATFSLKPWMDKKPVLFCELLSFGQ